MNRYGLTLMTVIASLAMNPSPADASLQIQESGEGGKKTSRVCHEYDTLKKTGPQFIQFLNEQGATGSQLTPSHLENLFSDTLELVIHGKSIFQSRDHYLPRLKAVKSEFGDSEVFGLDSIACVENQACVVRNLFRSSKGGDFVVLAILRLDDLGLIAEINEVYNKYEGSDKIVDKPQEDGITHSSEILKETAQHYINFLDRRGRNSLLPFTEFEALFANSLTKIVNGATVAPLAHQLQEVENLVGTWTVQNLETLVSPEDQAMVVRYVLRSSKAGNFTTIAFLRLDAQGLIKEINEVCNVYEQ